MIAFCRPSGFIEFGDTCPPDCWLVAEGDEAHLRMALAATARRAVRYVVERRGYSPVRSRDPNDYFIAPGVPEARTVYEKRAALITWLRWIKPKIPQEVKVQA